MLRRAARPGYPVLGPLLAVFLLSLPGCASTVHTVATELDLNTVQLRRALESPVPGYMNVSAQLSDRKILAQYGLSRDATTRRRLQRIVNRIVASSHKKRMRLHVRLLDDETVNAFVTGGGYVYVFRGLLDEVESESEIATILGHEIAHIDAGHISRRQRSLLWTSLALLAADALTKGDTADGIISAANALIPPAFSRKHEREADILGTIYAKRIGFNPRRMNDFFRRAWMEEARVKAGLEKTLRAEERAYNRANSDYQSALATYTTNQNRHTYAATLVAQQNLQVAAASYEQSRLNYAAFVRGSSPLFRSHPVNEERMETVSAVSEYASGHRSVESFPSRSTIFQTITVLNDVENRERAVPFFREAQGYLRAGDADAALDLFTRSIVEDPKYPEAWSAIGDIYVEKRDGVRAAAAFEKARSADPREFREEWKLGWAYATSGREGLAVQEFERAVRRDKKNSSLRAALGDSYMRVNQPKKALRQYHEATDLAGTAAGTARLYLKMASCYEVLGKDAKARESLEAAMQQDSSCTECRERLQEMGLRR